MKSLLPPLLLLLAIMVGCSKTDPASPGMTDTTHQDTTGLSDSLAKEHAVGKGYDKSRGGVQIVTIHYDQTFDSTHFGVYDEWVLLQSDKDISTKGWKLDADDVGQRYDLPDTLYKTLNVYTHKAPTPSRLALSLNLPASTWIWNNTTLDIARLYDDKGTLIDSLTYKAK
ncbi:MAG: lamin tail domain-containing protein [Candidatus Kapaibacterium sp.]